MNLVAIPITHLDTNLFIWLWKLLYCQFGIWMNNELKIWTEAYWNVSRQVYYFFSFCCFLTCSGSRRLLWYLTMLQELVARNISDAHGTAFVVAFEKSRIQSPIQESQDFIIHWRITVTYHILSETEKPGHKPLYLQFESTMFILRELLHIPLDVS